MKNIVMRIIAIILVLPLIADYVYFTINIFKDNPKYMTVPMQVFYILDILALIAVVVGLIIGKYAISIIGVMAYSTFYLVSILSQVGGVMTINAMMIAQCIPPLIIFTMMVLLLAKMVNPIPVVIVVIVATVLDLILDFFVRVVGNHMNFFAWGNIRLVVTNICYCVAIVLIALLTGKKDKIVNNESV
ncbi:MAG: hypothetical protein K6E58_02160 [Eubacterium sp.]|nr:hypothetical protein [Eubacterium sp.]